MIEVLLIGTAGELHHRTHMTREQLAGVRVITRNMISYTYHLDSNGRRVFQETGVIKL